MENTTQAGFDWTAIIGLLIIAGIFGNGSFGFGNNNNAATDISNEFLYNQLANQVRDNTTGITNVDRDVLTTSANVEKEVMQNRYDNAIQTQTLSNLANVNQLNMQNQLSTCCCEIKNAVHSEGEATRALITQNRIEQLQTDLQSAQLTLAQANQTQNLLSNLGRYVPYSYTGTTLV